MLLGIKCVIPAGDFVTKLRTEGLLCLTAGDNVLRILPPLIVGEGRDQRGARHHAQGGAGMAHSMRALAQGPTLIGGRQEADRRGTSSTSTSMPPANCGTCSISALPTRTGVATARSPARYWR